MIETSRFGHGGGRNLDWLQGDDAEDFMAEIEADEMADDGEEDHEAALDAWREQQDADGGDELECGLSRHQLRVAAKVLFSGLGEIFDDVLRYSHGRTSKGGAGIKNGAVVSAAMVAAVAVALELPGYQRGAVVAKALRVTRAGISIHAARFGRMLGVTSEASARKQRDGILAMARQKAGMGPRVAPVIHVSTVEDREPEAVKVWLESLPEQERETARRALKGKAA